VADITLANISPRVLDAIAYDLKRVSARKGQVLVSGFLRGSEPKRFKPETVWEQEEWLCWLCRPENIDADRGDARVVIHSQEWWQ
jgi:ribosomal protein L11 methylase PrmA